MNTKAAALAPSLFLIICLVGLPQLSETIYTPAIPDIAHALSTRVSLVEWTLTTYFIGFAFGVGLWGKWSDHIGRRKAMLLGLLIYILGSFSCFLAHNITCLLLSRVIQAFGASVGSVITMTIMRDVFSGARRSQVFSVVAMALAFAPALGPLLGGYLVQDFHWQANFFLLVMMGIALSIYSFFRLPETHPNLHASKANYKLLSIGKLLIKDRKVLVCTYLVGAFNGILFSYYAEAPYLFIEKLHYSASHYGLLGIFIALASVLGSLLSHRLNRTFKSETIIFLGCLLTCLSCGLLVLNVLLNCINENQVLLATVAILGPMLGFFIGFGIAIPNILSISLASYQEVIGTAGSLFGFSYYLLISLFLFGMGLLHTGSFLSMPGYFLVLSIFMLLSCPLLSKAAIENEKIINLNIHQTNKEF